MNSYSQGDQILLEELRVTEEELRAQNEELAESRLHLDLERERYRGLFEHAPVPYVVTDSQGVITDANHAAAALLRCRKNRLRGKPLVVFIASRTRRLLREQIRRLVEEASIVSVPLTLMPREGPERVVTATASSSLGHSGKVAELRWLLSDGLTGSALGDVDELRRRVREAEDARKRAEGALRSMSDLMGWASHEIRTPATSIGGYTEILATGVRGMLTPDQQAILLRIQQAQSHLVALLDDLLTFSRAGAGQLNLAILPVLLQPIIARVVTLLESQAAQRDVRLSTTMNEPLSLRADGERVTQILLNLVGNALKFTPLSGSIEIRCDADAESAFIAVHDSGPGVPVESRERIFQPYVQLRMKTDQRVAGYGLGLAISRELARAMDGDLSCLGSAEGRSFFVLRVPRSTGIAPTAGEFD